MQKSTLFLLLLLTAGLGVAVWRSQSQVVEFEEALFPGVTSVDVVSVRVDNVNRDVQVRIDRDGMGGWKLVDPIEAPADNTMLGTLMDVIDKDRLRLVPGPIDASTFGFEPPEILFQIETRSGERRSVEVGTVDVAHNTVHLRVRGKIYRAPLRLHTELTRDLDGYRRPFVFTSRVEDIGEFHRVGETLGGTHRFGYEFHALFDNDGWRLVSPFSAGLHPAPMKVLLTNLVRIPVRSYFGGVIDAKALGLEPPQRSLKFTELGGKAFELQVGFGDPGARFNCRALPTGEAFMTDPDSVYRLEVPIELLLDRRLLRAPAELVERIVLERNGLPGLELTRTTEGWSVAEGDQSAARVADPRLFDQFFANLKTILFYDLLEVGDLNPGEQQAELRFYGAGEEWALRIGGEHVDEGVSCWRVQQASDGIVALLEVADADFLGARAADLRDHRLTRIDELGVESLVLNSHERSRRWNRDARGKWTREGREQEAFEILALIDPLLHLRAESYLSEESELVDPLVVEVFTTGGDRTEIRLGRRDVEGVSRTVFEGQGELALVALDQATLPEQIEALLALD